MPSPTGIVDKQSPETHPLAMKTRSTDVYPKRYFTADELSLNVEDWQAWAEHIHAMEPLSSLQGTGNKKGRDVINELDIVAALVTYPVELKNLHFTLKNGAHFVKAVRAWAKALPLMKLSKMYQPPTETLVNAWSAMQNRVLGRTRQGEGSHSARILLSFAFSEREGAPFDGLVGEALALPWVAFGSKTNLVECKDVKADYLAVRKLEASLQNDISCNLAKMDSELEEYRFRCTVRRSDNFFLPAFTLIEKPDLARAASARLLTLAESSIQHQRRALCFRDTPSFGAIVDGQKLVLFATFWEAQKRMASVDTGYEWNLSNAVGFVECYYFMCTLSVYISERMGEDVSDLGEAYLKEYLTRRSWRPLIMDVEDELAYA